jgi:hypothetical protein
MNQTTVHALYILVGIVTLIVGFGAVTSLIEAALGGWGKLAKRFPAQQPRTDQSPDEGEAVLAFTKQPYSLADDRRGRGLLSGMGCLYTLIGAAGLAALAYGLFTLITRGTPPTSVWALVWTAAAAGWTVLILHLGARFFSLKAFHRPVRYTVDDEHLHLQREGSAGLGNTRLSIPWAEIDRIEPDPVATPDQAWARFRIAGERWAHAWRDLVEREMAVRGIDPTPQPQQTPPPDRQAANEPSEQHAPAARPEDAWNTDRPEDNWGDVDRNQS